VIGGTCSTPVNTGTTFWEDLTQRDHFEDLSEDGGIAIDLTETGHKGMRYVWLRIRTTMKFGNNNVKNFFD
jgi:hypothetical protein